MDSVLFWAIECPFFLLYNKDIWATSKGFYQAEMRAHKLKNADQALGTTHFGNK